jgi:Mor family transcriptional regulator
MRCINIEHLFLGTHKDNMDDRQVKGRTAKEGRPKALTDEECVEIIRLRNLGTPINDLAMKYFVSTRLIYRVLSGEDRSAHPFR